MDEAAQAQAPEGQAGDAQAHSAARLEALGAADPQRRFGGLSRLYGEPAYAQLRCARIAVVGIGGVGSWAAEALARSGVAALTLIDMDHIAESNINRQLHALESTLGQSKVLAQRDRIAQIHPDCQVQVVEDFVDESNVEQLLHAELLDGVIDCCDQVRAKVAVAAWARSHGLAAVCVGAAGGKRKPQSVELADLAEVTHDPLLANVRQRWRQRHAGPRKGPMGLCCVFSREPVRSPVDSCDSLATPASGGAPLNCAGYGSSVTVTATFGMVAAAQMMELLLAQAPRL